MSPAAHRSNRQVRIAAAMVAAAVGALFSMGCLSLNFGNSSREESVISQTGNVPVAVGQEVTVYYPRPYASPPNLQTHDEGRGYHVIEQKADCFRVRNDGSQRELKWTARGMVAPASATTEATPTKSEVTTTSATK